MAYYYTRDDLNSGREVCNSSGTIVARYDYDPYGRMSKVQGTTVDSDFQYAGCYLHAASGLFLTKFRAYDSNCGRWLSRDPCGVAVSLNLYNYVDNSPASFADPLGLFTFNLAGFLTGVAGAAGMGALVTLAIAGAFIAAPAFGALGAAILLGGCVTLAALGILSLVSAAYGAFTAKDLFTGACLDDEERSELLGGLTVGILSMLAGGAKANDINKNPGRLGKVATRIQNYLLALELQLDGWTIVGGGGMMPEEYLPGPNGARKGSNWVDITATKDGKTLRVQTVTTSDGTNPTPGELAAAAKIQAKKPGDELILIPKW